jgi:hypothetical protein
MLDRKRVPPELSAPSVRDRIGLRIVESGEHSGFVIPHHAGVAAYRGTGSADYACGRCGGLLAIGVRPGMFSTFIFACACGAMNAVE